MVCSSGKFLLIASLAAFAFATTAVGQITDSGKAEIRNVLARQMDAWNKGDIRGYMEGYWKSDSLLFTSRGNVQRGWNATLKKYLSSYSAKGSMGRLKFSDLEINLLSPTSAWVFGRWELMRAKDHPGGVFTLILEKLPEGWRIIHDHTSSGAK